MIPSELKKLNQWVCWRGEQDGDRLRKVPINAKTGGAAQSNNPDTWCDYDTAVKAAPKYSGIGFMFGNGYFGIDIDNIDEDIEKFKSGDMNNIVSEFVHSLQTYSEYSVSGSGIHLICKGKLPEGGRRKKNVEMYSEGRFFVMTGNIAAEYTEINDCTETVKPLHEKYIGGGRKVEAPQPVILELSDDAVIQAAMKSKQGAAFGHLMNGNWDVMFTSQSEADMSFCNMLAFWCRKDAEQMDRIFRSSGMMRDKWDRRQSGSTYGRITIDKAISQCETVYTPPNLYEVKFGNKTEKLSKHSFDDTGNADRMYKCYGDVIKYSYVAKKWLYYDGRRWVYDYDGTLKNMADNVLKYMEREAALYDDDMQDAFEKHRKKSRSSTAKNAMLKETEHRVAILPNAFDTHKELLNTPNGVLNLRTGQLQPHNKDLMLSMITYAEYTENADCPQWLAFLDTIFNGDTELIRYIQKAVGYSLTGSTREQCAFFLYGDGRNGKSTFLDVISDMLGEYAVNVQPETLMVRYSNGGPTSDIARLKGARFVTSAEPSDGMRLNEGLLKQLTGGDKVTASRKYENEFEFKTEFKLWISMNHRPIIRGTDEGIWRRIHLIPFTTRITDEQVDKLLPYKLKREMPAIFHWALQGCMLWQKEGLNLPQSVFNATKEYRSKMDAVGEFIDECCTVGEGRESGKALFEAYKEWAQSNNEYVMTGTKFGIEMSKRFEKVRTGNGIMYQGISLNTDSKPYVIKFGV